MKLKNKLQSQIRALRKEIRQIEAEERKAKAASMSGLCYVYRNCYSCPEGPQDYWLLYSKVTGIDDDGFLEVLQFQTDIDGKTTIETQKYLTPDTICLGEPLSDAAFNQASKELLGAVSAILKSQGGQS